MNFVFTPMHDGKPLAGITVPFNGTAQEALIRASNLASGLVALVGDNRFTVRVDRTDRETRGYEVGADGHTVERHSPLTPTTSRD